MQIKSLEIPCVKLITPARYQDERGYFEQSWHEADYKKNGIAARFVQDNFSKSSKGVLRGLHYQRQNPQAKLVSVFEGEVFDVAVDLRRSSPYFGQWVGARLSADNGCQLYIPQGFAHGFLVLSETVRFYYKCDAYYAPGDEYALRWDDPGIAIQWPQGLEPLLSDKDSRAPVLNEIAEENLFD
ncbi:MAG: dTDP-4-dehydrorhamnose 3,5-epimerase [Pseudomonadales bacterium]|nr:dTDP-4-dehydrorhamnose 3,5-epimerase [Pseudomonadales bacterium]